MKISEICVEVELQALPNNTVKGILKIQRGVFNSIPTKNLHNLFLMVKWKLLLQRVQTEV